MLAFKTQLNITNELLFLKIPNNFKGKRVEVIVFETEDTDNVDTTFGKNEIETFYNTPSVEKDRTDNQSFNQKPNEFQKFLLTSPTWTDAEYQSFVETRKLFNQWKIE